MAAMSVICLSSQQKRVQSIRVPKRLTITQAIYWVRTHGYIVDKKGPEFDKYSPHGYYEFRQMIPSSACKYRTVEAEDTFGILVVLQV